MNVWRDRLHRWLSPLARRCPLSPNTITLIALALNAVGAWLMYERRFLFALGIGRWGDSLPDGVLHGLKIVAALVSLAGALASGDGKFILKAGKAMTELT